MQWHAYAAWLVPLVVALLGAIVFLEINVPRLIAKFGIASLLGFFVVDAAQGSAGGITGGELRHGLEAVVGPSGAVVVLTLLALSVALWVSGLSLKRAIGWCIAAAARLRAALGTREKRAPAVATANGPRSLREAVAVARAQTGRARCGRGARAGRRSGAGCARAAGRAANGQAGRRRHRRR